MSGKLTREKLMPAKDAMDQDNSSLLSDATLSTLHLQHQPFTAQLQDSLNQDDEAVLPFSDSVTEEQLADIKQALITGDDLLLVLGEQGAGKSTLLQQLDTNSGLRIQCFPVAASERFNTLSLFSGMLAAFHQEPPANLKDVLDQLIPHLQSMVARNTLCTIVLDDAHLVKKEELTQLLSGMLYMNSQDETVMRITLSANEEFEDTIPELLPEGADLPYSNLTVEGLSAPRAAAYLDYRLQLAGFDQEFPFTERDMDSLVEHSAGRPGQLHVLTADVLNEKYGRLNDDIPSELLTPTESSGFMQSRFGKLALGAVAILFIAGGLLMFMPNDGPTPTNLAATEDTRVLEEIVNVPDLQVIESQSTSNATRAIAADATEAVNNGVQDTVGAASEAATEAATLVEPEPPTQTVIVAENTTTTNTPAEAASAPEDTVDSSGDNTIIQSPDEPASEPAPPVEVDDSAVFAENTVAENEANAVAIAQEEAQAALRELNEQAADTQIVQTPAEETTPANAPTSTPELLDDTLAGVLESPTWILVQDDEKYTIQLSASRDLDSIQAFLRRNPLPAPNSIFSFERAGEIWYALVHGSFDGVSDAQRAVERMPESAQRDQPWIRSIARVKAVLLQP